MFNVFIKVTAKSTTGNYKALIQVDHIGSILESAVGCQVVCKNGDIVPVKDNFSEVEKMVKKALGGTGMTVMV